MKPEEMAALGQDFRNRVQIVQRAKERKEREVYEFVEELLTLMAHIAEKEGENLKEDNIFTWSKKRELESQESLYLGNFTTNNENNEDQKVSSYVITGQGIEVNFIYNKESDKPCFNEDNYKKLKEILRMHNIYCSDIQKYRDYITFTYRFPEKTKRKPDKLEKAFKSYGRKRSQLIRRIEKNPKLIAVPLEELSNEICDSIIQLLNIKKDSLSIETLESFNEKLSKMQKIWVGKGKLQPGELLSPILKEKGCKDEYRLMKEEILLKSHGIYKQVLVNGEIDFGIINKCLEDKNIKIVVGEDFYGIYAIIEYFYHKRNEDEQTPVDKSFSDFITTYNMTEKAYKEDLEKKRDDFAKGIFTLLNRAIEKLDKEGCQISYYSEKLDYEDRIQELGNYNIKTDTKNSEFTFNPETGDMIFILYYPYSEIDKVDKLLPSSTKDQFYQYGINITREYDYVSLGRSYTSTAVGSHLTISCNIGLSKKDQGIARTLKDSKKP